MFVVKDTSLKINWEFKWIYRRKMGEEPDTFSTYAYVKFLDRDSREEGILGAIYPADKFLINNAINKDECRLNLLYQALESICRTKFITGTEKNLVYKTVLEEYAFVHSVPKHNTKLGPYQKRLQQDLVSFTRM